MKRILRLTIAVFMCIMILPMYITETSASAKEYYQGWDGNTSLSGLDDNCDMFSESEEAELTELIQQYSEQLKMNIYIFLAGKDYESYSNYSTECFADDRYDQRFGEDTDGVYFFMDYSGKVPNYHYISTSGKAVLTYQKYMQNIFSHMKVYMPKSSTDYSGEKEAIRTSVEEFLNVFAQYSDESRIGAFDYYYDYDSNPPKYFYYFLGKYHVSSMKPPIKRIGFTIAGLVTGLITALIVYFTTKRNYKFKNATNANIYLSKETTQFTSREDVFMREHTSRSRIDTDSDRSGGGGGGFSGGGHSSGGGHGGGGFST
jgi:uncharacterized protein